MSNATIKVIRFHELGGPEVLKMDEMVTPQPGSGEVRLRVQAIGLNRAEVMFRQGKYLIEPTLPSKIGYEAAGVVEAVGAGVDSALIGKKFSTVPCFHLSEYGVCAEAAIVPVYALAAYPEKLSTAEASSIWMQYLTAYGALVHHAGITKGDFVVITAASSSVGLAAIEMVRAEGAISIATTRSVKKKQALLDQGADHVIVTDEEDLPARIQSITHGKGARVIFDPIAGKNTENLIKASAVGGIIFLYGSLSLEPTPFPLFPALVKGISIRGYTLFEVMSVPALRAKAEKYVFDHLQNGTFKPKIARTFPFAQIADAYRYMESNEQIGKIVVTV